MTLPLLLILISNNMVFLQLTGQKSLGVAGTITIIPAVLAALCFVVNICLFRRPGRAWNKRLLPPVSVLIPARNEEHSIAAAIRSILASRGVELELIVLDDGSTDRTAEIVQALAEEDLRLRLETAPPLPEGWNGKQHACWHLASLATHDVFCFVDADVRVGEEAIYRMVSEINYVERDEPERALVSGFPRQETHTLLEKLLIPLIHFVLLGYLPFLNANKSSAAAAGCGQFMMVRREPYFSSGGHSANPATMHDGLILPRLFRRKGFRTSVYDMSRDASCRMYANSGDVWRGLVKNATEGMASPLRLPIFTILLFLGQVIPIPVMFWAYEVQHRVLFAVALLAYELAFMAMVLDYGMRFFCAWRYKQSWLSAFLHPLGVLILLALQWYAFFRKLLRRPSVWKQREYQLG